MDNPSQVSTPGVQKTQITTPTNQSSQEVHSKGISNRSKMLLVVGVVLGFTLFGVGGYYLGMQKSNQQNGTRDDIQSPTPSPTNAIQSSPTSIPNPTSSVIPTSKPDSMTTWKPSINLFTINVPSSWTVTQGDGGAGSVDSIVSPDYVGDLGTGSILEIKFGPLSGSYPDNLSQSEAIVGNKKAVKMIDGNTVYHLVKGVYSPVKDGKYNILLVHDTDEPDIKEITEMLNSVIFEPTSDELINSKTIP